MGLVAGVEALETGARVVVRPAVHRVSGREVHESVQGDHVEDVGVDQAFEVRERVAFRPEHDDRSTARDERHLRARVVRDRAGPGRGLRELRQRRARRGYEPQVRDVLRRGDRGRHRKAST